MSKGIDLGQHLQLGGARGSDIGTRWLNLDCLSTSSNLHPYQKTLVILWNAELPQFLASFSWTALLCLVILIAQAISAFQAPSDGPIKSEHSQVSLWPAMWLPRLYLAMGGMADVYPRSIKSFRYCDIVDRRYDCGSVWGDVGPWASKP